VEEHLLNTNRQVAQPGSGTTKVSPNELFSKCRQYTRAADARRAGLYPYFRELSSGQGTEVTVDGKSMVMVGSNNYLGLADDPRVEEAVIDAVRRYGTGSTGSRFLNGNLKIHRILEERLSAFIDKEAVLVFSTGFLANVGLLASLVGRNDVAITDRLDHASIIDGCRLALGEMKRYMHNDMDSLEMALLDSQAAEGILIVVDGVFSMEGDIAPLPEILDLARTYGARVMVDEAHALGVLGPTGRGTVEQFGVNDEVDIVMGTFSKALASMGGFIASEPEVIEYVKHVSRAQIFTAGLSPADAAAALKALEIIQNEPERRAQLWRNTRKMKEGLVRAGFDTGKSETPVIPVVLGDEEVGCSMWRCLHDAGVFVNLVVPPAVPQGRTMLRVSCMATHTEKQLDFVLETFERVGRELGIL